MSSITKYEGKTFTKQAFVLEESYFVNCVLKDCDLFYSGGDLEMLNCQMIEVHWHFRGPALKTMQMAQMWGMLKTSPTPPSAPLNTSKMN